MYYVLYTSWFTLCIIVKNILISSVGWKKSYATCML